MTPVTMFVRTNRCFSLVFEVCGDRWNGDRLHVANGKLELFIEKKREQEVCAKVDSRSLSH
jgi:hypothetical protein